MLYIFTLVWKGRGGGHGRVGEYLASEDGHDKLRGRW